MVPTGSQNRVGIFFGDGAGDQHNT